MKQAFEIKLRVQTFEPCPGRRQAAGRPPGCRLPPAGCRPPDCRRPRCRPTRPGRAAVGRAIGYAAGGRAASGRAVACSQAGGLPSAACPDTVQKFAHIIEFHNLSDCLFVCSFFCFVICLFLFQNHLIITTFFPSRCLQQLFKASGHERLFVMTGFDYFLQLRFKVKRLIAT